jgi:hypothetical protein
MEYLQSIGLAASEAKEGSHLKKALCALAHCTGVSGRRGHGSVEFQGYTALSRDTRCLKGEVQELENRSREVAIRV